MRRGYNCGPLELEGKSVGFNLGADFTAEHEWGIKKIQEAFGIPADDSTFGLQRRTITTVPKTLSFFEPGKGEACLIYGSWKEVTVEEFLDPRNHYYSSELKASDWFSKEDRKAGKHKEPRMGAAWSESDFGVHVVGEPLVGLLRDLHTAFANLDVAIWRGGGGVFKNASMVLAIRSRLPRSLNDKMTESDADALALKKASEATGIHKVLNDAGKRYFALSPKWKDEEKKEVVYWLNPFEQDRYNSGWFTVDNLKAWLKDEGPIVKIKEKA